MMSSGGRLRIQFGTAIFILIFACALVSKALAATYDVAIPVYIDDPKREQVLEAARFAAESIANETLASLSAQLRVTTRLFPRLSFRDPAAHTVLIQELLTPQLVAAFDATQGASQIVSLLLANASVR